MQLSIAPLVLISLSFASVAFSAPLPSPEVASDSTPRIEIWKREPEINRPSWRRSPTPELPGAQELVQKRSEAEESEVEDVQKVVVAKVNNGFPSWSAVVPPNRVNRNPDYILL